MNEFARQIHRLDDLCKPADKPQWWMDLLSLWRPSGVAAGDYGLRLAVRDNYLNFYRLGQSIARVEVGSDGQPRATTHIKYVPSQSGPTTPSEQEYLKVTATGVFRGGEKWAPYEGIETLKSWVRASETYSGEEKKAVDKIVAVNPDVIDLEMGLPAWAGQDSATRMDLVAIERRAVGPTLVFWEAKLVSDSRIRCQSEVELGRKPEVLQQLAAYRSYLDHGTHSSAVASAYRNAAVVLQRLRDTADAFGDRYELGREIVAAASEPLHVEHEPRLVVLNNEQENQAVWQKHAAKLGSAHVAMQVMPQVGPFNLQLPT